MNYTPAIVTDNLLFNKNNGLKNYLSVETLTGRTAIKDLEYFSSSFIRYSRNQYFAKKGYQFQDTNLVLFFKNQKWYKENKSFNSFSDKKMIRIIDTLKYIEENYGKVEYRKILYKYNFNGYPLFYIGWDPQVLNERPNDFFTAAFVLLDTTMLWAFDCTTIPPEFLVENSIGYIEMVDVGQLKENQIKIKNIDKGYIGGEGDEMLIHLYGYSDDDEDVILGFNNKGEFVKLLNRSITIDRLSYLNDSTMKFTTSVRTDFFGTGWSTKVYHFNTKTKELIGLPLNKRDLWRYATSNDIITVYKNHQSAINKSHNSIIAKIDSGKNIKLIKHLDKDFCYEVRYDTISGWMNWNDIFKFGFHWPD